MNTTEFVELVKSRHPELAVEIDLLDDAPNSTLTSGALARLTRRAIDDGDHSTVERCFGTALAAWDRGDDRVQNAVALSYLRMLKFQDGRAQRAWAWPLLHPRLRDDARALGVSGSDPGP